MRRVRQSRFRANRQFRRGMKKTKKVNTLVNVRGGFRL